MSPRSRRERRRIAELEEEATELRSANLTLIKKVRELRQGANAPAHSKDVTYLEEPRMTVRHYRKRPVVVEASDPLTVENMDEIVRWVQETGARAWVENRGAAYPWIEISTLEGWMRGNLGDRVIRGVQGEFYPCKPDIFDQTYEPVE